MRKSKWIALLVVGLLTARQAKPDLFGMDMGVLMAILVQVEQQVMAAKQIYDGIMSAQKEVMQAANYIKHPQSWTNYLNRAANMGGVSNGNDANELGRINAMLKATRQAYAEFQYQQLNAGDMARMNQLGIQMVDLQQRADSLNAALQSAGLYRDKVKQSGGFGCVSCTVGSNPQ